MMGKSQYKSAWDQAIDEKRPESAWGDMKQDMAGFGKTGMAEAKSKGQWGDAFAEQTPQRELRKEGAPGIVCEFTLKSVGSDYWLNAYTELQNPFSMAGEFRVTVVMRNRYGQMLSVERERLTAMLQANSKGTIAGSIAIPKEVWGEIAFVEASVQYNLAGEVPLGEHEVKRV
jgi:hypothetical protein